MNEQSAQAYVNLIEQLLARADGEELNNILQANQELIDPQFLQVMENYATGLIDISESPNLLEPPEAVTIAIEQVARLNPDAALAITCSDPGDNLDLTRNTPIKKEKKRN